MGLVMEAAAENNVEMLILDRPNPLGGNKFEGRPFIEEGLTSLVSQFPITYLHGFTIGELATFLNEEGLLANHLKCKLSVVKMSKWKRRMKFGDTGLPWVISSPHIPRAESATYCAITGMAFKYMYRIYIKLRLPLFNSMYYKNATNYGRKRMYLNYAIIPV